MNNPNDTDHRTARNDTDDVEPLFGDGSHRAATPTQTDIDQIRHNRRRGVSNRIASLGRIERYGTACVLVLLAGATVGVYQILSVGHLLAEFVSVFTVLLFATVILLTVGVRDDEMTDASLGSRRSQQSTEVWPLGWRRP